MCYSAQIKADYVRYVRHFGVTISLHRGGIHAVCRAVVLLERMGGGLWQVQLQMPLGQSRPI